MELELKFAELACCEPVGDLVTTQEESMETAIPEYCPDIARIVDTVGQLRLREKHPAGQQLTMGGSVVLKSPKTRTSARRLGITGLQDLQQVLRRAWERRRSDDPKEWVVLRQDGTPPKPDQLTRDLLTVVRRQGLPKISLHGLRHSFASVANSQGVPMFDISRTLGHSSMTVTSNIYTHLFDDTEAQALAAVARAIEKA